jgi:predicted dehydrogenase
MDKLKVGVIGSGFMGSMHSNIFNNLPNAELVGIFENNHKRSKKLLKIIMLNNSVH